MLDLVTESRRARLTVARAIKHHPMLLVNAALLVAVALAAYFRYTSTSSATPPAPADLFMQSVANEDGSLGWNQLCPSLQVALPRDVLEQKTQEMRADHDQSGVKLAIEHVGDLPRASGGQIRVYVATARTPDGSTGQKTYVLQTQASGCVESVQ